MIGLSLALPWSGCEYIHQKEQAMRSVETDKLLDQAQKLAKKIQPQLMQHEALLQPTNTSNSLYLHPLAEKIQLDGYHDDWVIELNDGLKYTNQLSSNQPPEQNMTILAGLNNSYLYLFIQLTNEMTIYSSLQPEEYSADHIVLDITHHPLAGRYFLQVTAPGRFEAFTKTQDQQDNTQYIHTTGIQGYWQDTATGYNVELRLPRPEAKTGLGFTALDYSYSAEKEIILVGQYGNQLSELPSTVDLIKRSPFLQSLLDQSHITASRVYILNPDGWILASKHSKALNSAPQDRSQLNQTLFDILSQIYMFVSNLRDPPATTTDSSSGRIISHTVKTAARKAPVTSWYKRQGSNQAVISIAYPVQDSSAAVAAIIIMEQNNSAFMSLQNPDFLRNIAYSLLMIIILSLLLFIYTWKLTRQLLSSDHLQ
ncbi:MAG: hypothetical protein ACN4GM_06300 [Gammaproteobacteria bacterium]